MKYKYTRYLSIVALLLAWSGTVFAQVRVDTNDLRNSPKIMQTFRPIVAKPREATVRVFADGKDVAFGTIVESDGWILTAWTPVKKSGKITCKLQNGKTLDAKITGVDDEHDLIMLKIDAKELPTVEWRPSSEATVGKWVASVGLTEDPIALGIISVAKRNYAKGDQGPKLSDLNAGWLGVGLENAEKDAGAKINSIAPKSPAEVAKIKVNDVVYEAVGKKIIDAETFQNTVGRLRPGDKVQLKIRRGKEVLEIEATLGKRDPKLFGVNPQETMGTKLSVRRGGFKSIIQHDSGVSPENCGGPLVDLDGKTVGINVSRAGRTETYAIPADSLKQLVPNLKEGILFRATGSLAKENTEKTLPDRFAKVHEIPLPAGVPCTIELTSPDFDAYLIVQDAKSKKLAEDNDSGGGKNAKILFRSAREDTYRVTVTSFNFKEAGNYTLTVRMNTDAEAK